MKEFSIAFRCIRVYHSQLAPMKSDLALGVLMVSLVKTSAFGVWNCPRKVDGGSILTGS